MKDEILTQTGLQVKIIPVMIMVKAISVLQSFFIALGLVLQGLPYFFKPTAEFDLNSTGDEISSRACGYLYGLAQEEVPSSEAVKSLNISSLSQKVLGGLQHPISDVDDVSKQFYNCDYVVVYLQDCYPTWYYHHKEIEEMRKNGVYDSENFVETDFLPKVRRCVTDISQKDYADKIVYCPYNECDNTVWFGSENPGGWLEFDDAAKARFYDAWKKAYDIIKSISPNAKIGGPGYCDYNIDKITHFLKFCKENDCVPDIMIYHELNEVSSVWWKDHVDEYRREEKSLGIDELPVIVTEYGCMFECGVPQYMLHYIKAIEESGTYGNVAFWRLADNLCDTVVNANCPNSNWWLYKWYCDMKGRLVNSRIIDIAHSDFENTVKYARDKFHYTQFDAFGSYDDENKTADIICGGCDYEFQLAVKNAKKLMGKGSLRIKIEAVTYEGLSGEVFAPTVIADYSAKTADLLKIKIDKPDKNAVYHVTVKPDDGSPYKEADTLPARFEFEHGTLLGTAYTYDSAYGTTGEQNGMCGGFEKAGDGITLDFSVPESGEYELSLIYGKCNDGASPADRKDAKAVFIFDGDEGEISLPNTIKSEYTNKYTFTKNLAAGQHTITLKHKDGTFTLDSLLVRKASAQKVYCRYEKQFGEYLIIAPSDGYYRLSGGRTLYFKRGFNYIDGRGAAMSASACGYEDFYTVDINTLALEGTAGIKESGGIKRLAGITSEGGSAEFTVNAPEAGRYAFRFVYSNNEEGGMHDYNVDLIEEYITLTANGTEYNLWCINTYSEMNFLTAVAYIDLKEGENTVKLSNSGYNSFNGRVSTSPDIASITVNPYIK